MPVIMAQSTPSVKRMRVKLSKRAANCLRPQINFLKLRGTAEIRSNFLRHLHFFHPITSALAVEGRQTRTGYGQTIHKTTQRYARGASACPSSGGSKPDSHSFRFLPSPLQALQGSASLWDFREINRLEKNESTHLSFEADGIGTARNYEIASQQKSE